jgi:NodT family efflux transporter outer membrane factor (OMF) lipoprotein
LINAVNLMQMKIIFIASIMSAAVISCAVGPNFRSPEAPNTLSYTAEPLPEETTASTGTGGASQRLISGQDIPGQWWKLFHSAELEQLIRQALADNPTLAVAQATLRQSQENLNALVGSALYPAVNASGTATKEKISGAEFGEPTVSFPPFTIYNASVSVSYSLDLFGGARRELEALRSQVDYQRFQLEAAYLTITSNIVTTAVKEALLRAQLSATQEIIAAEGKQLEIVEQQFQLGGAARTDVLAQRTQLAQTRTTLPPLQMELAQTRHLLAVLVGRLPSEAANLPQFTLEGLQLPIELPVSLPSSLVRQRPDIRASEALLHAANAEVGVATANLYPQLTLTGSYGTEATTAGTLFRSGTAIWGLGGGLLLPLFHGGALNAQRRAAVAVFDQAAAQYRQTILQAFQNVADVLRALEADANELKAQADADASARDLFELTQKQFQLGAVNYLSLLNAEREYQQAKIGLVQAQAARFSDTAALFQALGGGWWNRLELTQDSSAGLSRKE